ncbi:MAG: GNAT family N-acetyltransferase [Pyrinomonadaceae bacterium]
MINTYVITNALYKLKEMRQSDAFAFDLNTVELLTDYERTEVLNFLKVCPVHTVIMASFICDNGMESEDNRGKFYGYRNSNGELEGVALIGHTTLIEARSEKALKAFALTAQTSETPIKMMMSHGDTIERFWNYYAVDGQKPQHNFKELLFELNFPFPVQDCEWNVRPATADELEEVATAQAVVAFMETGIDPLVKDREGFLKRCLKRIEKGRTFVVFENGKLIFKIDIMSENEDVMYLEGLYVAEEYRGFDVGSKCLAKVSLDLLGRAQHICGLSNAEFTGVHCSLGKAGYKNTDFCQTIFV